MRHAIAFAALLGLAACSGSQAQKGPIGAACAPQADGKSADCANGLCIALDTRSGFCSKDCSKDHTCPDGFSCALAGRFGLVCQRARGCKTDDDCPAGHRCDADSHTCYIKVSRVLCSPCEVSSQCPQGGTCFTALGSGEMFCTAPCEASGACPAGYACQPLPGAALGQAKQCLPVSGSCNFGKPLCAACKGDNECGSALDLCVRNVVSGEQFCGTQCAPDRPAACPSDFTCTNLMLDADGGGPFQCVPNSGTCAGHCDSPDEHVQTLECGLGRTCDTSVDRCAPATDGRQCSPCQTNDDCQKTGHPANQCILNSSPNSPHQGETFCAEPCPATGGDAQCQARLGPGFTCQAVGNESFCVPVRGTCLSGLGRLGDSCAKEGADECIAGVCLAAGAGSICSASCSSDAQCGDARYRCCALNGDQYDCGQRNSTGDGPATGSGVCAPLGGQFGDDCSPGRPPCESGACLDLGTAELCTQLCPSGSCPADFTCQDAVPSGGGATLKVCFPTGGGVVGSDCTFGPAACADRLCIKKDSGNVCTKACTTQPDCPTDYLCEESVTVDKQTLRACIPPSLQ